MSAWSLAESLDGEPIQQWGSVLGRQLRIGAHLSQHCLVDNGVGVSIANVLDGLANLGRGAGLVNLGLDGLIQSRTSGDNQIHVLQEVLREETAASTSGPSGQPWARSRAERAAACAVTASVRLVLAVVRALTAASRYPLASALAVAN